MLTVLFFMKWARKKNKKLTFVKSVNAHTMPLIRALLHLTIHLISATGKICFRLFFVATFLIFFLRSFGCNYAAGKYLRRQQPKLLTADGRRRLNVSAQSKNKPKKKIK